MASLDSTAGKYRADLALPETEDSWDRIAKALIALKDCLQNGAYDSTAEVVQVARSFHAVVKQSLLSERTRLSSAALDFMDSMASACGADLEPLLPLFFPTLMVLTGRTNKVVINRTKACVLHIIDSTLSPSLLPHFLAHLQEKSPSMRLISAQSALAYMKCCNPPDLEKETRACDIENLIRKTVRDANADVRKVGREIFDAYKILLPHRVDSFVAPLTPTIRKYLDIKASANPKLALSRVKSMSALTVMQSEKRPESKYARTGSVAITKSTERNLPQARPRSVAASRPVHPQVPTKVITAAWRPDPSRQVTVTAATSTGPSRMPPSTEAVKIPHTRTRILPSVAPQRTFPRPTVPTSSSSSALASSGPRRVPLPSPDHPTEPVVPKTISRPASQQSIIRPGSVLAVSRPSSQQNRPVNPPVKPLVGAPASRAMPPPRTRADGSAIGGPTVATTSKPATAAEPAKRPRLGVMQPTASQLAKVKALVNQKGPVKKPLPRSTQGTAVLNKSLKTNVTRPSEPSKIEKPEATVLEASILPPSLEPLVESPVPQLEVVELVEENVIERVAEEPEPAPKLPASPQPESCPPEVIITDFEVELNALPNTPTNIHVQVDLTVQNVKTPISALLTSIQQGFEFSPASPLSPPHTYLNSETQPLVLLL